MNQLIDNLKNKKERMTERTEKKLEKVYNRIKDTKAWKAFMFVYMCALGVMLDMSTKVVYADIVEKDDADAKKKWETVIGFVIPWIKRLGGVVVLIGAIEFGLAWKNDDAEGKTKGMRTIIAGCIVTAVGYSANTFLA